MGLAGFPRDRRRGDPGDAGEGEDAEDGSGHRNSATEPGYRGRERGVSLLIRAQDICYKQLTKKKELN